MFLKIKTKEGAFTLIELLIVIALIGLLASAVSVAVNPGKRIALANDAVRKQNFGGLTNTLLVYYVEKGSYPYVGDDLMADSTEGDNWIPSLRPDYLKTLPKDPKQAGIITTLAQLTRTLIKNQLQKPTFIPQPQVAAATSTLSHGISLSPGALGYEANIGSSKWNLPYIAGVSLAQQWVKLEPQDDVFDFTYFDQKLAQFKAAGKKANLRVHVGPSSPDWLRTQKGIKTVCWNQSGSDLNQPFNCFPWMTDPVYRAERKEMFQAIYNHYKGSALESTISYVYITLPTHSKTEEAVIVQFPSNDIYLDPNDASGVPIGVYCVSTFWYSARCLTAAELLAMTLSKFNLQGYSEAALFQMFTNSIVDAASVMPTWNLLITHGSSKPSPLRLYQNDYRAVLNNNLISRVMIGLTWLGHSDPDGTNQVIWDDVNNNFFK